MSNVNRPRTGLKPCGYCTSTDRDSNGQCHCRNVLYRALRGVAKTTAEKVRAMYNSALQHGSDVEAALAKVREEYPSLAPKPRKAPADKKTKAEKRLEAKESKKNADLPKPAAKEDAPAGATKERYILHIEDEWTEPKAYARKDAAIKNGVRSNEAWKVTYKGKVVAQSDDLI